MDSLLGKKIEQTQKFLENGTRIPVTKLGVDNNVVIRIKTPEKDLYSAVQLGFEKRTIKNPKSTKPLYRFVREVRFKDEAIDLPTAGNAIKPSDIFKEGDIVNVTGISKGKGYAGGVKRYHFRGGPRTHGQSDRERAPGAVGTGTTPGRVLKGKRMAGRMGHEKVTVRNLQVISVEDNFIIVKGLVPGGRNSIMMLKKVEVSKKFVPLYQEVSKVSKGESLKVEEVKEPVQEEKIKEVKEEVEIKTKEKEEANGK